MNTTTVAPNIVLTPFDITVVVFYFIILFGVSYIVSKRGSNNQENTTQSYFSADKEVGWLGVGLSLFASNIGSEHFVGLAGTAADTG